MSGETRIGVDFFARTDAAQQAVRGLAAATREQLEAADAAGKGQKGLGREVAQTRALQLEATEATRAARQATADHARTLEAFGKDSREAAASLAKLSAAEDEARRATGAAADSLTKTAKAVEDATRGAEEMTPAMKRAAAQVSRLSQDLDRTTAELKRMELGSLAATRAVDVQAKALERQERLLKIIEREEREAARAAEVQANAIAASVSVVDAGTHAVQKAAEAHREAALVARAFGKDSREAAAAQQTATIVQTAAGRAAAAATAEVRRLEAEIAKVRVETNAATPAMQRLEDQLLRAKDAAEKQTKALEHLELEQRAVARGAKDNAAGFDLAGMASSKLTSMLGPAALTGTLIGAATWFGTAAEKTLQYQTAMANLPFTIEGAQRATRGLVSEQTLMAAASSAVALKVATTSEEFEELASASVILAAKLNQPADQLLNNLVTALGRGSTELLDNAGIVMKTAQAQDLYAASLGKTAKQLTDTEKSVAFRTEALKAIKESADSTTVAFDSNAAMVVRWKVALVDAMDALTRSPITAMDAIEGVVDQTKIWAQQLEDLDTHLRIVQHPIESLEERMRALTEATHGANQVGLEWLATQIMSAQQLDAANDAKYKARADQLQKLEEMQRRAAVGAADQARAKADALGMGRDRDAREEFGKEQGKAEKSGERGAKQGETAAAKRAAAIEKENEAIWAQFTKDAEVAAAASKESQRIREEEQKHREEMFDREASLQDRRLEAFDHEGEMLAIQLERQALEGQTAEEAQRLREELLDRRLVAEREAADQLARMAASDEQREQARTRAENVERQRQLTSLRAMAAAEKAEHDKRAVRVEKVLGHINGLGAALTEAAWQAAEGQKGAGLMALGEYLKTVSKQMAVKALVETALGVSALAGVVTAGLAPGHFAAAGMAAAAAVAAGGAGVGLASAGRALAAEGKGADAPAAVGATAGAGSAGPAANGPAPVQQREMQAQDVPVSYAMGPAAANAPIYNINLTVGTIVGAGGVEKVAQDLTAMLETGRKAGTR